MKDIVKIFTSSFPKDAEGYFKIPTPLEEPAKIKNAPDDFSFKGVSSIFSGEVHSVSSLETNFPNLDSCKPQMKTPTSRAAKRKLWPDWNARFLLNPIM